MSRHLRVLLCILCAAAAPASGAIISISGGGIIHHPSTSSPINVNPNQVQANVLQGFDEQQDVVLVSNLVVNLNGTNVTLLAGTMVDSHFLWFDPAAARTITGVVATFDQQVLGVILTDAGLFNTHDDFGLPDPSVVDYPSTNVFQYGTDGINIAFTSNSITVSLTASSPGDHIRVLTVPSSTAVPEASSFAIFFSLLFSTRRRCTRME
jgi:hypothetical protein